MAIASVDENGYLHHYCQGCATTHIVPVANSEVHRSLWGFNGKTDAPTLTPSVKHSWGPGLEGKNDRRTCHYFITDGQIAFQGDCTHAMAGKTVPLKDMAD